MRCPCSENNLRHSARTLLQQPGPWKRRAPPQGKSIKESQRGLSNKTCAAPTPCPAQEPLCLTVNVLLGLLQVKSGHGAARKDPFEIVGWRCCSARPGEHTPSPSSPALGSGMHLKGTLLIGKNIIKVAHHQSGSAVDCFSEPQ